MCGALAQRRGEQMEGGVQALLVSSACPESPGPRRKRRGCKLHNGAGTGSGVGPPDQEEGPRLPMQGSKMPTALLRSKGHLVESPRWGERSCLQENTGGATAGGVQAEERDKVRGQEPSLSMKPAQTTFILCPPAALLQSRHPSAPPVLTCQVQV